MTHFDRRRFLRLGSSAVAAAQFGLFLPRAWAADAGFFVAETAAGKVRGTTLDGVAVFRGIPYGDTTAGANRFMPPQKVRAWTGVRDALQFGSTAPQGAGGGARAGEPAQGEDCLVLNVFTPHAGKGGRRPVLVWLHGGGFATGSASSQGFDGSNLAREHDVVVVTVNHRLNALGQTYLAAAGGAEFAASGSVGIQDIVAALQWVRENIEHFGGDAHLVTLFGQSGGGRKIATLMAMPSAQGLYHRAIIESGAVLRLSEPADAAAETELLLQEVGLTRTHARELQNIPLERLLAANAAVQKRLTPKEPGEVANTPTVDGKVIPRHPWDPSGPAISAHIPLLIGWARTEETFFDRPTPEKMALDEAGLQQHVATRLGVDPGPVIAAFRQSFPDTTPWDIYVLIATSHPRAAYTQELGKRKALQGGASAWMYRFDWETPEGGGHLRSPHTIEIAFAFDNIRTEGPLIAAMPEAYALAKRVSASWAAFARTGNPNTPELPQWPAYSVARRETMLFNNECRVADDPQQAARVAMERVLKLA